LFNYKYIQCFIFMLDFIKSQGAMKMKKQLVIFLFMLSSFAALSASDEARVNNLEPTLLRFDEATISVFLPNPKLAITDDKLFVVSDTLQVELQRGYDYIVYPDGTTKQGEPKSPEAIAYNTLWKNIINVITSVVILFWAFCSVFTLIKKERF